MNAPLLALGAFALSCALCTAVRAQEARTSDQQAAGIEPKVEHTVIQDKDVRIEELRVRGRTQRITVQPKGMKGYEILPADEGHDMSESAGAQRGAAGQRVWRILTF
jgi:hypothetical protein